jgi:predicted metal-dependent hydrolase
MADITVRNIRFGFDEPIDFDVSDEMLGSILGPLALSMTMPYLEPYLIRSMKVAIKQITDPVLAEDVRRFCQQEGHHFRNHALLNDQLRGHFEPQTADALRAIEADLEADYQRFSREKPLRWNLAYAEGFEAMTCAGALAAAEHDAFASGTLPGGEIWGWHMAEEIEHRTVAFGVFRHLVGSYLYRIAFGTRAQWHYVGYIRRFANCMAAGLGRKPTVERTAMNRSALRRYLHTWSPWYDPAKIEIPVGVDELLARYSAMAKDAA